MEVFDDHRDQVVVVEVDVLETFPNEKLVKKVLHAH